MKKKLLSFLVAFVLISTGILIIIPPTSLIKNVKGVSEWTQETESDFNQGILDNVIVTNEGIISLAQKTTTIEDNFYDESMIEYKKNIFIDNTLNEAGLIVINKTFGGIGNDHGRSVQQTSDGGFIITGWTDSYGAGKQDVWLIKTNSNGVEQWNKTFGGEWFNDRGYSVQQTSDGGYIITGLDKHWGGASLNIWLIKTNPNGVEQWNRSFNWGDYNIGHSVQQTSDGGYIITGYNSSFAIGGANVCLIKTNSSGFEQWNHKFGGNKNDFGYSVQQTSDGGYIINGYTMSFGAGNQDVLLIKTNSSGIEQWTKTFGGSKSDFGHSVQQTSDGGYIISGNTSSYGSGGDDVWLIKTNSNGIEQWNKKFGGNQNDFGHSVQQTSDGGYIISGNTSSYGSGGDDVWLIKTDSSGNQQWNKTLGGSLEDISESTQQTSDGGFIIAGSTMSYGTGNYDVWLIKTNATGEMYPIGTINSKNLLASRNYSSINSFDYNVIIPTGTNIEIQFSQDNFTWYSSNGQLDQIDILIDGTESLDLSPLNWSGSSFYYRMFLKTNSNSMPRISNISISYNEYLTSGTYISAPFNSGNSSIKWKKIGMSIDIPNGTELKLQLRSANLEAELSSKTFVGPNSKSSTYYYGNEAIWTGHDFNPFIQYKIYFITSDESVTPKLYNITLIYNFLPNTPTLNIPLNNTWINNKTPNFNWTYIDLDSTQAGFQLLIDNNKTFNSINYDSGEQESNNQTWLFPRGTNYTTIPDGIWYWKVRTKDDDGDWGPYSLPSKMMIDSKSPTNLSISINEDNDFTNSRSINIKVEAKDKDSGISKMAFGNDRDNFTSWELFKNEKNYNLTTTDGKKTIYYTVQDHVGNIAEPVSDSIILDTLPPIELEIIINDGAIETNSSNVYLEISAIDNTSGLSKVSFSNDGSSWTPWENYSKDKNHTLPSGDGEKRIYYRVMDNAGNIAEPVSASIFLNTSSAEIDTDGDNVPDVEDLDDDGDNYLDSWEEFLGTDKIDNKSKPLDTDKDGKPDGDTYNSQPWMDEDDDGDGYFDPWEDHLGTDILDKNSKPLDTDDDGKPDGDKNNSQPWMDEDDDNDGYSDAKEMEAGTDPLNKEDYPGKKKDKKDDEADNSFFIILLAIIIIIIILILLFLALRRKQPKERELEEIEEREGPEDWEAEREGEEEGEEWQMADEDEEVGELEELEEKGFEEEPEEWEEEEFEAEVKLEKPLKGKVPSEDEDIYEDLKIEDEIEKPIKGIPPKKPMKGNLPVEPGPELEEEFEEVEELEPITPKKEYMSAVVRLERKSEKCGICLGAIKTGLLAVKCRCGKFYHDSCGLRVGECPSCEAKFDKDQIKKTIEESEMEDFDFSTLEEFKQEYPKKAPKEIKEEPGKLKPTPIDILKERLAKGEIDYETYKQLKKEIE